MSSIEDNLQVYKDKVKKQKYLKTAEKNAKKRAEKVQKEKLQKQKDIDDKERATKEKLITYSNLTRPSERIFNYYKDQLIKHNLEEKLLESIQNTGEINNIILFADNSCSEALSKAFDFGDQGSYTDQLRYGLDLNTIFGNDFLTKSTRLNNETLLYPYQIDHDRSEFERVKRCLMHCMQQYGPYKYIVKNGTFKGYILYGEIKGSLFTRRYVYGIRKERYLEKLVKLFY